ncbi:MAG: metal-dependent transcriptional regulator [Methanolinea sp.]|nr:metal-dependent transcriptional regulator [Methanolinea sp.]
MKTSSREDILEAICLLFKKNKKETTIGEVTDQLALSREEVSEKIGQLEQNGDLEVHDGETISLTPQGKEVGDRTMKKHEVLECFLSDVLGMDRRSASREACILEHGISDAATERLEGFMSRPRRRGWRTHRGPRHFSSLLDFPEGTKVTIVSVRCPLGCEHLADLGIFPGEDISIVRVLNHKAIVVRVKGCDIALSPEIASCILAEKRG